MSKSDNTSVDAMDMSGSHTSESTKPMSTKLESMVTLPQRTTCRTSDHHNDKLRNKETKSKHSTSRQARKKCDKDSSSSDEHDDSYDGAHRSKERQKYEGKHKKKVKNSQRSDSARHARRADRQSDDSDSGDNDRQPERRGRERHHSKGSNDGAKGVRLKNDGTRHTGKSRETSHSSADNDSDSDGGRNQRRRQRKRYGRGNDDDSHSRDHSGEKRRKHHKKRDDDRSPDKRKSRKSRHKDESDSGSPCRQTKRRHSKQRRATEKEKNKSPAGRGKRHLIKPDTYDGLSCVETFLVKFEDAAEHNDWDAKSKASHLKSCLTGDAGYLIWETKGATYDEIVDKLRRRYGSTDQQEKFRVELRCRKRKSDETLQKLAYDVEKLIVLAYPEAGQPTRGILGRDAFISAPNDRSLQYKVREKEPTTFRQALTIAMRLEILDEADEMERDVQRPRTVRTRQTVCDEQGGKQAAKLRPADRPPIPAQRPVGPADQRDR